VQSAQKELSRIITWSLSLTFITTHYAVWTVHSISDRPVPRLRRHEEGRIGFNSAATQEDVDHPPPDRP